MTVLNPSEGHQLPAGFVYCGLIHRLGAEEFGVLDLNALFAWVVSS